MFNSLLTLLNSHDKMRNIVNNQALSIHPSRFVVTNGHWSTAELAHHVSISTRYSCVVQLMSREQGGVTERIHIDHSIQTREMDSGQAFLPDAP